MNINFKKLDNEIFVFRDHLVDTVVGVLQANQ